MRHAKVNSARTVAPAQVRLDPHLQAVDPRRGLRQDTGRLADDEAAVLLVKNLKAKIAAHNNFRYHKESRKAARKRQ